MMKLIPLSKGQHAIVDDEDYDAMNSVKWYTYECFYTFYAMRTVRMGGGKKKSFHMHRMINKTPDGMLTDHINGNGLDNRKENLRSVSHKENMVNCARNTPKRPKYRGISWHKSNYKWYAQITIDSKNIYIGSFHNQEEAASAYNEFREKVRAGEIIRRDNEL